MSALLKTCYLNGAFQDIENTTISVLDRGFIFGDAVYEVIPVFQGVAFHLDLHLKRLAASMEAIRISPPCNDEKWQQIVEELIGLNGKGDQSIYLQVTRGVAPRDHAIPQNMTPTVFLFSAEIGAADVQPIAAITAEDIRWQRCDIKATSLLANVLLRSRAIDDLAVESILFRDDVLTEGAASNVFIVIDNVIYTSRETSHILAGITRRLLIDLLTGTSFEVVERDIPLSLLSEVSEMWITSSSKDLVPVTMLDGQKIGNGEVGKVFQHVANAFQSYKTQWLEAQTQE